MNLILTDHKSSNKARVGINRRIISVIYSPGDRARLVFSYLHCDILGYGVLRLPFAKVESLKSFV